MATFKQIAADARTLAGEMNFTDPNDSEVIRMGEESLKKIGKLLQGIDPRIYGQVSILNCDVAASGGVSSSSATYTVTSPAKTITETNAFTAIKVGAIVIAYASGTGPWTTNGFAYVVSKTNSTLVLDRDICCGLGTPTGFKYIVISPLSTGSPTLSISAEPISEIVMVTGTLAGNMIPCNVDQFLSLSSNPNFDSSGAFYHDGQNIRTYAGSGLTNGLGIVFVFFKRKPRTITALTDTVDLPIKYHQILRDDIASKLMMRRGKIRPPELADPLAPLLAQMTQINAKSLELARAKRSVPNK